MAVDLTVAAIPGYFGTMGAEYGWLRRRAERRARRQPTTTRATRSPASRWVSRACSSRSSTDQLLRPFVPGKGPLRQGARRHRGRRGRGHDRRRPGRRRSRTGASGDAPRGRGSRRAHRRPRSTVVTGGLAVTTTLAHVHRTRTGCGDAASGARPRRPARSRCVAAVLAWDFIYYWNHRFMHESRYMWAIHVVHHSSERYNLSTALRQPVADAVRHVPARTACCALLGIRPALVATGAGHQPPLPVLDPHRHDPPLGPFERVLNTPSHHRVHHGSNPQYLDRNHGSILIVWDRLVRDVRARGRARRLRPHQEHRHVRPGAHRDARARRHAP